MDSVVMASIIIGAAIVVAALAVVMVRWRARADAGYRAQQSVLEDQLTALQQRLQTMVENQAAAQAELAKTLNDRLDQVSQRMGQSLTETATKTAQTLGELNARLNVIDEAQKNITELSGQVVGLQDILANKQARGAFGEIQLADLVRAALPPSAYRFQATLSNKKRADCLLTLPNPPGAIVIDAKFPLESYAALRAAEDDAAHQAAERGFRVSMLKHINDIAERYIIPGETAESALMFLPSEAVYAELHASFEDIVQQSYRKRVWIVSPTTLMATLNTIRAVLKDARMREQAHVIQTEVGKMVADVERLQSRVANLQRHFGQAEKDVKEIVVSSDKIVKRTHSIENVQLDDDPEDPAVVDGADGSSPSAPLPASSGGPGDKTRFLS